MLRGLLIHHPSLLRSWVQLSLLLPDELPHVKRVFILLFYQNLLWNLFSQLVFPGAFFWLLAWFLSRLLLPLVLNEFHIYLRQVEDIAANTGCRRRSDYITYVVHIRDYILVGRVNMANIDIN